MEKDTDSFICRDKIMIELVLPLWNPKQKLEAQLKPEIPVW